jgi:uncharacterized protein (DUF2237 family)
MHGMILYFQIVGAVFVPICFSVFIRRWIARLRSVPKPPSRLRKRILPSDKWCEAARKWRD